MSKRKRKGRAIDHVWEFVKYKGDLCFYARCSCGFRYGCWKSKPGTLITEPAPEKLYNYCPLCGARKTKYSIRNERIDKYSFE